jgi:hypothetical protein
MSSSVTTGMGVLMALALSACAQESAPTALAAPPPPEVIATTRQVMLGITIPTSDVVFQVGAKAPETDADWEKVEASALALAESGAMLTVGSRVVDREAWLKHANDLIASAKSAAAAAREHNVDQVLEIGNTIYEVCDGCHAKYMAARQGEEVPAEGGAPTP